MKILRWFVWFLSSIGLLAVAMYVTATYNAPGRITGFFLRWQSYLPVDLTLDQFLVVVTVFSSFLTLVVFGVCASVLTFVGSRTALSNQQHGARLMAARREASHIKEQYQHQYEQLQALARALSKRLDKGMLVQSLVQAVSRMSSTPQANSAVSLWLMHFETETINFETGIYCDETMFVQTKYLPTEQPLARVLSTRVPWLIPQSTHTEAQGLLKMDKLARLGGSTSLIVAPLIIEETVLGILMICCHPDILKAYEEQRAFYDAMWGELALGLAIALQGELAILDRLTGVYNRDYFMKRFNQELDRANRYQLPLTLLMLDIDNFKAVNDTLGHPQGDAVLKIVARILKQEVRAIDLVARYGGEEFIILLPETGFGEDRAKSSGSLVVAERIRKGVDDEFRGFQKPLNITISIGAVVRRFPEDRQLEAKDLVRLADEQLYHAKTTGKNKVYALMPEQGQEV